MGTERESIFLRSTDSNFATEITTIRGKLPTSKISWQMAYIQIIFRWTLISKDMTKTVLKWSFCYTKRIQKQLSTLLIKAMEKDQKKINLFFSHSSQLFLEGRDLRIN